MVTNWRDNWNAGESNALSTQVQEAAISAALDIQSEALAAVAVPPSVPAEITQQEMHNRRSHLAFTILQGSSQIISSLSFIVAVNLDLYLDNSGNILKGTGDTAPTKAEIKNSVSAVWNAVALDCKAV